MDFGSTIFQETIGSLDATKLSKRITWLNAHAGLQVPINLAEASEFFTGLDDGSAMKILKQLEMKAASVRDPAAYLKAAVRRALTGEEIEIPREQAPLDQRLRTRINWLNANVPLHSPLDYDKVGPLLAAAGAHEAMDVLKKLEESAAEVRDPSSWVVAAARNLLGGHGNFVNHVQEVVRPVLPVKGVIRSIQKAEAVQSGPLRRRIDWLNNNVPLKAPLVFDKVAPVLANLGHREAMDLLKKLEEKAESINDPTAYVAQAARRAVATGSLVPGAAPPPMMAAPMEGVTFAPAPPEMYGHDDKLKRRIAWLNSNVPLQQPLAYDKVAPTLLGIDSHEAMGVLKNLEENAATVHHPDAWVVKAAARCPSAIMGGPVNVGGPQLMVPPPPPAPPAGCSAAAGGSAAGAEKLWKRINWLNANVPLAAQIQYDRVAPLLLTMEMSAAMEILKKLENEAANVKNPTAWVESAARRSTGLMNAGHPMPHPPGLPEAIPSGFEMDAQGEAAAFDQKLRKRIGWLNHHAGLQAELRYDQVVASLHGVGLPRTMEILKELEGAAASIRDPNGWVVSATRRGASRGVAGAGAGPAGTPRGSTSGASPEDRLRKRMAWLNANVLPTNPLDVDRVLPSLLALDIWRAMAVLKRLEENVASIPSPSDWVNAAVQEVPATAGQSQQELNFSVLRDRVDWLNANVPLTAPLVWEQVGATLVEMEGNQALDVLKTLEENAAAVEDPNLYVLMWATTPAPDH